MLSKLWSASLRAQKLFVTRVKVLREVPVRRSQLLPPNQYDVPLPKRMMPGTVLVNNWEVIPLFTVTSFAMLIMVLSIGWAMKNKVDVVWTSHSRENISRTMDLRNPSCHKLITINQTYEPWDEMQDALDAVNLADKRHRVRKELADRSYPKP